METEIPFILLALQGKVDFIKSTTPFMSGDSIDKAEDPSPELRNIRIRELMTAYKRQ